jgi:hypothetical protein
MRIPGIVEELQGAIKALEAPFLAVPEHGYTPEKLAYRRGARDAYIEVLKALGGCMKIRDLAALMEVVEEYAGDCKIEVHKIVPLDHAQQVKVALAFEVMLDGIEDAIRNARDTGPA